jgi:hypothetical protein
VDVGPEVSGGVVVGVLLGVVVGGGELEGGGSVEGETDGVVTDVVGVGGELPEVNKEGKDVVRIGIVVVMVIDGKDAGIKSDVVDVIVRMEGADEGGGSEDAEIMVEDGEGGRVAGVEEEAL